MTKIKTEQQLLKHFDIPNFRHMTKDMVLEFQNMIPKMEKEVAIKAIEQFPEFAKNISLMVNNFQEIVMKDQELDAQSTQEFYNACNIILESLKTELGKDEYSFEEKESIADRMVDVARMIGEKDTENKEHQLKRQKIVGGIIFVASLGLGSFFGIKAMRRL